MTVTHYHLTEEFELTRVVPGRDTIRDLYDAAEYFSDEDCTWSINGTAIEFKRPLGTSLTAREETRP
ncbi:hypothetical protein [Microbacterium gilvum]|uniref:Halobacterial output domain-containing protein n=1 Tax=Microbacterium gilvum TaxID=1336204 RepID=A0ABP9A5F3_9MICO